MRYCTLLMRHLFITVLDCVASWPSAKLTVGASLTEAFRNDMTTCPAGPGLRPSLSLTTMTFTSAHVVLSTGPQ